MTKLTSSMAGSPFLHLTECRISRAAKSLGCEFGDLIALAARGAIKLCISLDQHEHRGVVDDPHLESIEGLVFDVIPSPRSRVILNERASYYALKRPGYDGTQCIAYLQGFWTISTPWLKQVHLKSDEVIMGGTVGIETVASDRVVVGMLNIALAENREGKPDSAVLGEKIWILYEDLQAAHRIIQGTHSSEAVQPIANSAKSIVHGNSLINEEKRQAILNAALTAMDKWPRECHTIPALAQAITDHHALLFKEKYEGRCPRALSGVLTILREAIKNHELILPHG